MCNKRLLRLIVCLLLWASPAQAAVTIVQGVVSTAANAFETDGIEVLTYGAGTTVGNFNVVCFWLTAINRTVSSVVDSGGNTYAILSQGGQDATHQNASSATEIWCYGAPITTTNTTVTVTINSALATPARMAIWEVTGQNATPVEDVAIADNGAVADASHAVGPVTTAAAGNMLFAVLAGSSGTYSNEAGWTTTDNQTFGLIASDNVDAATTTYTATSAGNELVAQVLVAIQPAAGGATCNGGLLTLGAGKPCEY